MDIDFDKNKLFEIHAVFSDLLSQFGPVYIAGGAVRDHLLKRAAKDYDIFILGIEEKDYEKVRQEICSKINNFFHTVLQSFNQKSGDPEDKTKQPINSYDYKNETIQIMVRKEKTILELLDTFDWNCTLFSYGNKGFVNKEKIDNIRDEQKLKLINISNPYLTLRRGYRFAERYDMGLDKKDLIKIITEIIRREMFAKIQNKEQAGSI